MGKNFVKECSEILHWLDVPTSVSRSSYACLSTSVCMEWDCHICRRCACRSRHCLAVVVCVLLSVDNLPFLVTDLQQLVEGHSLSLAHQLGTVSRRT